MADDYVRKTAQAGERVKARQRELDRQKKAKASQYAQYMAKAPQTEWHQKKKQAIKKAMPPAKVEAGPPTIQDQPSPVTMDPAPSSSDRWAKAKKAAAHLDGYMKGIDVGKKRGKNAQ